MPIYAKPVWGLMQEMVEDIGLKKGETLSRDRVLSWFGSRYPKIKPGTIQAHLIRMSTNAPSRIHYHGKPGTDDLFFQLDGSRFRLYDASVDPPPIREGGHAAPQESLEPEEEPATGTEFAFEADLRDYLAKNLGLIEPGLVLYDEEGITGVEFPVGGRFIDILAVASNRDLVVVELKVSRGYDRTVGQLLRYMGWIEENLADSGRQVRGVIVAREVTEDLLLACRSLASVSLFTYTLSIAMNRVSRIPGA
jgi:hypothetical protein